MADISTPIAATLQRVATDLNGWIQAGRAPTADEMAAWAAALKISVQLAAEIERFHHSLMILYADDIAAIDRTVTETEFRQQRATETILENFRRNWGISGTGGRAN